MKNKPIPILPNLNPTNQEEILKGLDFLWLEVTSVCNLECTHCYAESGPRKKEVKSLGLEDYKAVLTSARMLGCKRVQFIGGEPTLFSGLKSLIEHARTIGFEFIEVYSNATKISPELISCFEKQGVFVAVSLYARDEKIHDSITQKAGSHKNTVATIKQLQAANIPLRAGIVVMDENKHCVGDTVDFAKSLGITSVGTDHIRKIGRGDVLAASTEQDFNQLCGSCWRGNLCVTSNGDAYPCIMARACCVGSLHSSSLEEIVHSQYLNGFRKKVYEDIWFPNRIKKERAYPKPETVDCMPSHCMPLDCMPIHCMPLA